MSRGVGHRHGLHPVLLWLAAVVPVGPLAWESPYAGGVALKRKKKKKNPHSRKFDAFFVVHLCIEPSSLLGHFILST